MRHGCPPHRFGRDRRSRRQSPARARPMLARLIARTSSGSLRVASSTATGARCNGHVLRCCHRRTTLQSRMKTLTVRLPEALVAEIEAESRGRKVSKSDVVRERLSRPAGPGGRRLSVASHHRRSVGLGGWPAGRSQREKESVLEDDRIWPEASSLTRAFSCSPAGATETTAGRRAQVSRCGCTLGHEGGEAVRRQAGAAVLGPREQPLTGLAASAIRRSGTAGPRFDVETLRALVDRRRVHEDHQTAGRHAAEPWRRRVVTERWWKSSRRRRADRPELKDGRQSVEKGTGRKAAPDDRTRGVLPVR